MDIKTFTLTFGDCAENHTGMQKIGNISNQGFTVKDLMKWKNIFIEKGAKVQIYNLNRKLEKAGAFSDENAKILIVRNGLDILFNNGFADKLFNEQDSLEKDTKAFMYGRVVNKRARYNLCFDEEEQAPDYENKKGRIVPYKDVPLLKKVRNTFPKVLGDKLKNLVIEGNYYYDKNICGIGFHGDIERRKVVGIRLGARMPLEYQWYLDGKRIGERIRLYLNHGDIYFMSEKAVGYDWKKKIFPTLRHAAGCKKFLE